MDAQQATSSTQQFRNGLLERECSEGRHYRLRSWTSSSRRDSVAVGQDTLASDGSGGRKSGAGSRCRDGLTIGQDAFFGDETSACTGKVGAFNSTAIGEETVAGDGTGRRCGQHCRALAGGSDRLAVREDAFLCDDASTGTGEFGAFHSTTIGQETVARNGTTDRGRCHGG